MSFPKLREFNLGHETARDGKTYMEYATRYIQNENGEWVSDGTKGEPQPFKNEILPKLDCSSMTQLRLLDVTNHTNLSELKKDIITQGVKGRGGTVLKPCWELLRNDKRFKGKRAEIVLCFTLDKYISAIEFSCLL